MLLSPETQEKILAETRKYPQRRTSLLPALKLAQAQVGWLPREAIAEVADLVGVSHASANELATFYSMLNTHHRVDMKVEVCVQLPCALRGAEDLVKHCEKRLGVHVGETTKDGRITLRTAECLAACGTAPVMQVDKRYHENLTTQEVDRILDRLIAGG